MDLVINVAVEEICAHVEDGLTFAALWEKLEGSPSLSSFNFHLSPAIKRSIWTNLLQIPTLRFEPQPSSLELEDAYKLNLRIFAQQSLINNFVGLFDSQSLNPTQIHILHLLANARGNGITQSQLAKHFDKKGNNFHYVLRSLECQGLIVKHPALEKKKQISNHGESKNCPPVGTNLVYLRRYAKQLTSHQRFELEITKLNTPEDDNEDTEGIALQTDFLLKDYAPQVKAICDKLAKANGKVPVSVIKKDLGYCGSRPRRMAWKQICSLLKVDRAVKFSSAKVNGKIEPCLHLLDPMTTDLNSGKICQVTDQFVELPIGHQNFDMIDVAGSLGTTTDLNSGEICQDIDQFVELSVEQQIFDMIDVAGSSGITLKKICERLGIDLKRNHDRLRSLCVRFRMEVQVEQCHKSETIRVWTSRNFNREPERIGTGTKQSCVSPTNIRSGEMPTNLQELALDPVDAISNRQRDLVSLSGEADAEHQRYASLSFNVDSIRRANRILKRLEEDRFILRSEIGRWLASFEEDKKVDLKTIDRILIKLEEQQLCRCIKVTSPVVSEYSKTKVNIVVVLPSISESSELIEKIEDRVTSFNKNIRGKSTSRHKNDELISVKEDIQITSKLVVPDRRASSKAEAMRANGFVLAKMIRAKLLHTFLWEYLHRSANHSDPLSNEKGICELNNNPHSRSKLFSLEAAIKAIPVELFLQVVGSSLNFEKMIEKCKMSLSLSDISPDEYKCLMDTQATGRLSKVIDILRRLKLIRMVTNIQSRDENNTAHPFPDMMELKPYIEEPLSRDAMPLELKSIDLRPQIRHDFILSSRDAVDDYWQTLEYCYAAADREAAKHAFPGSMVDEVFLFRSWASAHLMTAQQRADLLKRFAKDELSEIISYRDCEKIAKDLNLTLEQVLSVYSSKRRHCLKQLKNEKNENNALECKGSLSRRRKYSSTELRPAKHARIDAATDVGDMHIEEQYNSGECATRMDESEEDDHYETKGSQDGFPVSKCVLSKMKSTRQKRFVWSDKTDRQLVMQYVRCRVVLGANYHGIDWASVSDLPAPPRTCMRRMSLLKVNPRFTEAVNRLCNILSEGYVKQLVKSQDLSLNEDGCRKIVRSQPLKGIDNNSEPDAEIQMTSLSREAWDDFENKSIKIALDEVLRCKRMAKLDASKVQSQYEGWSDTNADSDGYEPQENEGNEVTVQSHHGKNNTFSTQRSCRRRLDKKYNRFLNNSANVYGQVYESLAIANAVELFKLFFLSTSTSPHAPNLLADILRRYSEHDLYAAFSYLREKKFFVGGNDTEHFELSQQFLQCLSKSPFPVNAGKRALKFSTWLQESEKDLKEVGTNLAEDLQCGDVLQLFALVSLGDLSISACLPDNGVGEAEVLRNSKRKSDVSESPFSDKAKKMKSLFGVEGEIISRREKGFPGIVISACRTTVSGGDKLNLFKDNENNSQCLDGISKLNEGQSCNNFDPDQMLEIFNSCEPLEKNHAETPWQAMADYAQRLMPVPSNQEQPCAIGAEVFRVVYAAVQKVGDQGLSMEEVSQIINLPGAEVDGLIVDVLQAFRLAFKVNAFDSVRVVDGLYRHKYFLILGSDIPRERNTGVDDVHKVTILNLSHSDGNPKSQASDKNGGCNEDTHVLSNVLAKETNRFLHGEQCVPILPWINGDGTVNNIVYSGLRRRVLGIVMQKPGILEDDILRQMDVLNPQSCRSLLEIMVLDKHLIVRKMHQEIFGGGPSLLQDLIGRKYSQLNMICLNHFFANPMSASLL